MFQRGNKAYNILLSTTFLLCSMSVFLKDILFPTFGVIVYLLILAFYVCSALVVVANGINKYTLTLIILLLIYSCFIVGLRSYADLSSVVSHLVLLFSVLILSVELSSKTFYRESKVVAILSAIVLFAVFITANNQNRLNIEWFAGSFNRNLIKVVVSFSLLAYFIYSVRLRKSISYLIVLPHVVYLFLSNSRAGIVFGFIVLLSVFVNNYRLTKRKFIYILFLVLVLKMLFFYIYLNIEDIESLLWGLSRFQTSSGVVDPRESLLLCYKNNTDFLQVLFGLDSFTNGDCAYAAGVGVPNHHNSFIRGATLLGLPFIIICFIFLSLFFLNLLVSVQMASLIYVIGFLFINATESSMFFSLYDPIFISLVLNSLKDFPTRRGVLYEKKC
ncbi:hypothetical protein AB6C61_00050 [Vibrio splendidus]